MGQYTADSPSKPSVVGNSKCECGGRMVLGRTRSRVRSEDRATRPELRRARSVAQRGPQPLQVGRARQHEIIRQRVQSRQHLIEQSEFLVQGRPSRTLAAPAADFRASPAGGARPGNSTRHRIGSRGRTIARSRPRRACDRRPAGCRPRHGYRRRAGAAGRRCAAGGGAGRSPARRSSDR